MEIIKNKPTIILIIMIILVAYIGGISSKHLKNENMSAVHQSTL